MMGNTETAEESLLGDLVNITLRLPDAGQEASTDSLPDHSLLLLELADPDQELSEQLLGGIGETFTFFCKLPAEIRLQIWEASLPGPRKIAWQTLYPSKVADRNTLPQTLYVNSEARAVTLEHHVIMHPKSRCGNPVSINPKIDTVTFHTADVWIKNWNFNRVESDSGTCQVPWALRMVERVEVLGMDFKVFGSADYHWPLCFLKFLHSFWNLREMRLTARKRDEWAIMKNWENRPWEKDHWEQQMKLYFSDRRASEDEWLVEIPVVIFPPAVKKKQREGKIARRNRLSDARTPNPWV